MATTILVPKRERGTGDLFGVTCPPPTRVHCCQSGVRITLDSDTRGRERIWFLNMWIDVKKPKRHRSAHDVSGKVRPHRSYHAYVVWHLPYLSTAVLWSREWQQNSAPQYFDTYPCSEALGSRRKQCCHNNKRVTCPLLPLWGPKWMRPFLRETGDHPKG